VMNIIKFNRANRKIGLIKRYGTKGPEKNLINSFLKYIPEIINWENGDIAIFYEPRIESGYPDIVIVKYIPASFDNWPSARNELNNTDIKILHYLSTVKQTDRNKILDNLKLQPKLLELSITKLIKANLIYESKSMWKVVAERNIYGVRSIMAIEAKIKNWSDAFQQAQLNRWFASESYILSKIEMPTSTNVNRAAEIGVGIILVNGKNVKKYRKAEKSKIPSSYASWWFNEWIGRHLYFINSR
jgi:predicted transcriptional regulator